MNAKNTATGIVHSASAQNGFLLQTCGRTNTLVALTETTEEVTCKRCAKKVPAKVETPAVEVSPAIRKVIKALAGKGWVSWREVPAGNATVAKMVTMGLLESRASETEFRTI